MKKKAAQNDCYSNMRIPAVLVFCFCFLFRSMADGSAETVPHPFKPEFLSNRSYSEVYELNAIFGDGIFIQAQMLLTNAGLKDSNAACHVIVLQPGEKPWKAGKRFSKTDWSYSDTPDCALSIGHCRIAEENGLTNCTMEFGNARVSFSLEGLPDPVKTPSSLNIGNSPLPHKGKSPSLFYNYELLIPFSKLQAAICLPGSPKKVLSGFGILVYSRSVGYPKNFSRGWVYFYGCKPGCRFLANVRFLPEKNGGVAGWIWTDGARTPQLITDMRVTYGSPMADGSKVMSVAISAPDSSFLIASSIELYRFSVIDDLGPFLGSIIKLLVGNPVTRFYKAQVTFSPLRPPEEGILEIMRFE